MAQSNLGTMHQFSSVSSIHSMISIGYLPPGHGYIPKKVKPDKPYGPSYVTILNRTWRGPGRRWLRYALVAFCLSLLFYTSAALYFAHRNVQRLIVKHTEPLGALLLIAAILMTSATFHCLYKARLESNRWRSFLRFQPDGLFNVLPVNEEYSPRDPTKLATGTYGPRAVKEIPKPRYMKKSRPGSRAGGRQHAIMKTLTEDDEEPLVRREKHGSQEKLDGPQRFKAEMPEVHKPEPIRPTPDPDFVFFPPPPPEVRGITPLQRMPTAQIQMPPAKHPPAPGVIPGTRHPLGIPQVPEAHMPQESEPVPAGINPEQRFTERMIRPSPGPERLQDASRATPEPRMIPGSGKLTPEGRAPAGRLPTDPEGMTLSGFPPSQERIPAGRMPPAQERMPAGRMPPAQERMPAGRMPPAQERMPAGRMPPAQERMPAGRMPPAQERMTPGTRYTPEPRMIPGQGKQVTTPRMIPGSQKRPPPGKNQSKGVSNQGLSEEDL